MSLFTIFFLDELDNTGLLSSRLVVVEPKIFGGGMHKSVMYIGVGLIGYRLVRNFFNGIFTKFGLPFA